MKRRIFDIALCLLITACVITTALSLSGCSGDEELLYEAATDQARTDTVVTDSHSADPGDAAALSAGSGGAEQGGAAGKDADPASIFIHICGQVKHPGVYELPAGARAYQLLERCGGYTDEACASYLNQAMTLSDGEQIYIPSRQEVEERSEGSRTAAAGGGSGAGGNSAGGAGSTGTYGPFPGGADEDSGLVNINTADAATLQTITGIGASRAADIISYRESSGGFVTIEDIMKVPGIKQGLFSKIKDRIRV